MNMNRKITALLMALILVSLPALGEAGKRETVYVITDAAGAATNVIVSDHLVNADGLNEIEDVSTLSGIENVGGDQTFVQSGESLTWDAGGSDIYYQGTSDRALPITVKISYSVDGTPVAPNELAGRAGAVTIDFAYANATEPYAPFVALTALVLDADSFSNVEVTNGVCLSDGSRYAIVGIALPGLSEKIALPEDADVEIPESVTVTAETTDFSLIGTLTVLAPIGDTSVSDALDGALDRLASAASDLTGASAQLVDGSASLAGGASDLMDGAATLADGAENLDDGAASLLTGLNDLADGLTALAENNDALVSGAKSVFEQLIETANGQLAAFADAGIAMPQLTMDNYADVLDSISSKDGIRARVSEAAEAQVKEAVEAERDDIAAQVTQAVQAKVLETVLQKAGIDRTAEDYAAAVQAGKIPDETRAQISRALDAAMAGGDVQAQIESATDGQVTALVRQNLESDDVQAKIDQGVTSALAALAEKADALAALRETLDRYNAFYQGVVSYTSGVASAAAGAGQLSEGAQILKDGSASLATGADSLASGASDLSDGAATLADGMAQFDGDGVGEIASFVDDTLAALVASVDDAIAGGAAYGIYTEAAEGTDAHCVFLYRSGAIE